MPKNYYVILGIPRNATQEQIKAAYRHRAKMVHPDHYGEDRNPFLEVQEAYQTLRCPKKRKAHDHQLDKAKTQPTVTISTHRYTRSPIEPNEPYRGRQQSKIDSTFDQVEDFLFNWFTNI
jgi:curved DNA-binding protein CbpA